MRTRTELINAIIEANNYQTYIEIGVLHGENLDFVKCKNKIGVDPAPKKTQFTGSTLEEITSDEFFAKHQDITDIIFIDGLHTAEQSYIDALNSINIINKKGVVVLHDALPHNKLDARPLSERYTTTIGWLGGVWESVLRLAYGGGLRVQILDIETGIAVIHKDNSVPARELPDTLVWEKHRPLLNEFVVKKLNLLPVTSSI